VLVDHRTDRNRPGFVGPYRARNRAGMTADPEWQNYLRMNTEAGNLLEQRTCLMIPTKFAPIRR
jgi:hypothetical protein